MTDSEQRQQPTRIEVADNLTFAEQLGDDAGPIVLLNVFRFAAEDKRAVIEAWRDDSEFMKQQPGFVSAQLHEGHAGSNTAFNYAVWERVSDLRNAVRSPEFLRRIAHYPRSVTSSPHVFRALAVPGVCGGRPLVPAG